MGVVIGIIVGMILGAGMMCCLMAARKEEGVNDVVNITGKKIGDDSTNEKER